MSDQSSGLDLSCLTTKRSEIEESSATNFTSGYYLYFFRARAVEKKGLFNPDIVRNFSDREGRVGEVASSSLNDHPLEHLNPFLISLHDTSMDANGIAGPK